MASPDGRTVYAAAETTTPARRLVGRVVPIRTATNQPLRPIRAGHFPIGMTITPDGKTLYVLDWTLRASRARSSRPAPRRAPSCAR